MTTLNVIVAEVLRDLYKDIEKEMEAGKEKKIAIVDVLRKYIKDSKKIRFEGDGYSEEWAKEAQKRGLSNFKSTPEALDVYTKKSTKQLFEKHKVLNHIEVHARHEIELEAYIKKVQIESRVMGDLALNHIIPTAILYQNKLIENANGLKGLGLDHTAAVDSIKEISKHLAKGARTVARAPSTWVPQAKKLTSAVRAFPAGAGRANPKAFSSERSTPFSR